MAAAVCYSAGGVKLCGGEIDRVAICSGKGEISVLFDGDGMLRSHKRGEEGSPHELLGRYGGIALSSKRGG